MKGRMNLYAWLALVAIGTLAVLAWLYPQIFIWQNRLMMSNHDTQIPFENTFNLVSAGNDDFFISKLDN